MRISWHLLEKQFHRHLFTHVKLNQKNVVKIVSREGNSKVKSLQERQSSTQLDWKLKAGPPRYLVTARRRGPSEQPQPPRIRKQNAALHDRRSRSERNKSYHPWKILHLFLLERQRTAWKQSEMANEEKRDGTRGIMEKREKERERVKRQAGSISVLLLGTILSSWCVC